MSAAILVAVAVLFLPATAPPVDLDSRILPIERRVLDIERRVIPFDGAVQQVSGDQITVSLDAEVLFEFDKADLTAEAITSLTAVAAELEADATGPVSIVGHTDSIGDDTYNQDLSVRRATAVRDLLTSVLDTTFEFVVEGRGETQPVADNENADGSDNPENRRRNRRVEVTYTGPPPATG